MTVLENLFRVLYSNNRTSAKQISDFIRTNWCNRILLMNSQNTETVAQMSSLLAQRVALDIFLEIQVNKIPT